MDSFSQAFSRFRTSKMAACVTLSLAVVVMLVATEQTGMSPFSGDVGPLYGPLPMPSESSVPSVDDTPVHTAAGAPVHHSAPTKRRLLMRKAGVKKIALPMRSRTLSR